MKNILQNKKLLIIISISILLIAGLVLFLIFKPKNKDKRLVKETHTAYVSINPLVKLIYEEEYYLCLDKDNKEYVCGNNTTNITDYLLLNDDAKVYKEINFKGKTFHDALLSLCEVARNNNIGFESLEVTTDDKNLSYEDINEYLKEHSSIKTNFVVYVNFKEYLSDDYLEAKDGFIVNFDADNNSKVPSVSVKEKELVTKPSDPVKSGYEFLYWSLDNKEFDFNTPILENITLKAVWKKIENKNNEVKKEDDTKKEETKKENITKNEEVKKDLVSKKLNSNTYFVDIKNLSSDAYEEINYQNIEIIIKGEKGKVENLKNSDVRMVVNLKDLDEGSHKVSLEIKNPNKDFVYEINPNKIDVNIKEVHITSTFNKINLSDNILVNVGFSGTYCAYYAFPKSDVSIYKDKYEYIRPTEEEFNSLEFDLEKESIAEKELDSLLGQRPFGVSGGGTIVADHKFNYGYNYVCPSDPKKYGSFGLTWRKNIETWSEKLRNVFKDAVMFDGGCGSAPEETLLTEELCEEYGLPCSRW